MIVSDKKFKLLKSYYTHLSYLINIKKLKNLG